MILSNTLVSSIYKTTWTVISYVPVVFGWNVGNNSEILIVAVPPSIDFSEGNHTFANLTLDRIVQSEISDYRDKVIIPYLKQGSCREIIAPTVTQTTNCLMTVNADKTMSLTPLTETNIGQVTFEKHSRYTSEN